FFNAQGLHTLKVVDGAVRHAIGSGPLASVNDETALAPGGNRVTGVVAVAGCGYADLAEISVLAVDAEGGVWHTARLADGRWLRWGDVRAEIRSAAKVVNVRCASSGRRLAVILTDERGVETRTVRDPDGGWSR
ncbi:MAG: hypothetical protein ACRC33_27160, partial [Gemmataceae bacterium]